MKEMIYGIDRKEEILEQGNYMGYNYKIISYGTHPCAYIEIPKTEKLQKKIDELEELITKLKIIPFIDSIDFDTVKTSEFDDVAYMRRRININFLLNRR